MSATDDAPTAVEGGTRLRADCGRCAALCCVAPTFSVSADFAIDKAPGEPCPNLRTDLRCGIHARLRESGFPGCTAYDCFGAGQQVTMVTFGGRSWQESAQTAAAMLDSFAVMRPLHELLWLLGEALAMPAASACHDDLRDASRRVWRLTGGGPDALAAIDVPEIRHEVGGLLRRASELARAGLPRAALDHTGADLVGRNLRGAELSGACLRGALLVGADLTRADLRGADLLGADLRGATLGGADLTGALFLASSQLESARGDGATRIPSSVARPTHW